MPGFYPFGPPAGESGGDKPSHSHCHHGSPRPGPEEMVAMLREKGMIPPFVRDDEIMVVGLTRSGDMKFLGSPGEAQDTVVQWHPGDVLPHTARDFSDPPVGETPDGYRDLLVGAVNDADDPDDFRFAVMAALGYNMVYSHNVPPDLAVDAAAEFADWVYSTYRTRVT